MQWASYCFTDKHGPTSKWDTPVQTLSCQTGNPLSQNTPPERGVQGQTFTKSLHMDGCLADRWRESLDAGMEAHATRDSKRNVSSEGAQNITGHSEMQPCINIIAIVIKTTLISFRLIVKCQLIQISAYILLLQCICIDHITH